MLDGEPSSMMVFACAKCKTPLMHMAGVTSELDREEFARLRERLNRVLSAVMKRGGEKIPFSTSRYESPVHLIFSSASAPTKMLSS